MPSAGVTPLGTGCERPQGRGSQSEGGQTFELGFAVSRRQHAAQSELLNESIACLTNTFCR